MKFFKEHLKESICLLIFLVIILVCLIIFLVMWFGSNGDKYGSRLDGIESVQLSDSYLNEIITKVKEESIVTKAEVDFQGRLVNFIITVSDETASADAKKLTDIILENLTEDELSYYDIQVFIKDSGTQEESSYPVIGYKHKTSDDFSWSSN